MQQDLKQSALMNTHENALYEVAAAVPSQQDYTLAQSVFYCSSSSWGGGFRTGGYPAAGNPLARVTLLTDALSGAAAGTAGAFYGTVTGP